MTVRRVALWTAVALVVVGGFVGGGALLAGRDDDRQQTTTPTGLDGESEMSPEAELDRWREHVHAVSVTPVLPTPLPDGWTVSFVGVEPAPNDPDPSDTPGSCDVLMIEMTDQSSPEPNFVYMRQEPRDCALAVDATPFAPQGSSGLLLRHVGLQGRDVQYEVGQTVVAVDSSVEPARLEMIAASLAPIDIGSLIEVAAVP
jgi:hypothetical protein